MPSIHLPNMKRKLDQLRTLFLSKMKFCDCRFPSDFAPASSKEFLDIQATIECGFTLKRVRDMIKTYNEVLSFFISITLPCVMLYLQLT